MGLRDGLSTGSRIELGQHGRNVVFRGLMRDMQGLCDFCVAQASKIRQKLVPFEKASAQSSTP